MGAAAEMDNRAPYNEYAIDQMRDVLQGKYLYFANARDGLECVGQIWMVSSIGVWVNPLRPEVNYAQGWDDLQGIRLCPWEVFVREIAYLSDNYRRV